VPCRLSKDVAVAEGGTTTRMTTTAPRAVVGRGNFFSTHSLDPFTMELVSIDRCAARPPGLEASGEPFVKVVEWLLQVATHPPAAENIALPALQRRFPDCPMGVLSALVDYCAGPSMRLAVDGSSSSSGPGPRRLAFDPRPWTGTEILALLKAVGVHGDDWQVVAQAVRTRTPQDCLVYFLRLPVTDPFLDTAAVMANHGEATPGCCFQIRLISAWPPEWPSACGMVPLPRAPPAIHPSDPQRVLACTWAGFTNKWQTFKSWTNCWGASEPGWRSSRRRCGRWKPTIYGTTPDEEDSDSHRPLYSIAHPLIWLHVRRCPIHFYP